jgi:hypothetical protein
MNANTSMEHIRQFFILWSLLQEVNLVVDVMDTISWTLTKNGKCMDKSAYNVQFFGATSPSSMSLVWKIWVPLKVKSFA